MVGEVAQAEAPKPMWTPIKGNHAINSCTAVVTFAQPVTDVIWAHILNAARSVAAANGLDREANEQGIQFMFGVGGAIQQPVMSPATPVRSVVFFRQEASGAITDKLTVDQNSFNLETTSYVRWVGFRSRFYAIAAALLPIYRSAVLLSGMSLEYVDLFTGDTAANPDCSKLINTNSESIAKRAIQPLGQWHSNTGWFENANATSRLLVNIDIGVSDQVTPLGSQRLIVIRTLEAVQFVMSGLLGQAVASSLPQEWVVDTLHERHVSLKNRLAGVLTEEGQAMISLKAVKQ